MIYGSSFCHNKTWWISWPIKVTNADLSPEMIGYHVAIKTGNTLWWIAYGLIKSQSFFSWKNQLFVYIFLHELEIEKLSQPVKILIGSGCFRFARCRKIVEFHWESQNSRILICYFANVLTVCKAGKQINIKFNSWLKRNSKIGRFSTGKQMFRNPEIPEKSW